MANSCTNMFYCTSDDAVNLKTVKEFINDTFPWDDIVEDYNFIEGEFCSRWSFPEAIFEELMNKLAPDPTLYVRVLSYEFGCEYASFRTYRNQEWSVNF